MVNNLNNNNNNNKLISHHKVKEINCQLKMYFITMFKIDAKILKEDDYEYKSNTLLERASQQRKFDKE